VPVGLSSLSLDGNLVNRCSENTAEFDAVESICDHDSTLDYTNNKPCRFEMRTPLLPVEALFAAAGIDMNEPHESWLEACTEDIGSRLMGRWGNDGQRGLEKANRWLTGNKTFAPSFRVLNEHLKRVNFDYLCRFAKYPRFGTTLVVGINYNNVKTGGTNDIFVAATVNARPSYYHVHDLQPGEPAYQFFTLTSGDRLGQTFESHTTRHGISILVQHDGEICRFSFQALLLTLTSALGLIAIAGVVTDLLMVHIDPKLLKIKYAHIDLDGHYVRNNTGLSESHKHHCLHKNKHHGKPQTAESASPKHMDMQMVAGSHSRTQSIEDPKTCIGDRKLGSHGSRKKKAAHHEHRGRPRRQKKPAHHEHRGRPRRQSRHRACASSGLQGGEPQKARYLHKAPDEQVLRSKISARDATGHSHRHCSLSPCRKKSNGAFVDPMLSPRKMNAEAALAALKDASPSDI